MHAHDHSSRYVGKACHTFSYLSLPVTKEWVSQILHLYWHQVRDEHFVRMLFIGLLRWCFSYQVIWSKTSPSYYPFIVKAQAGVPWPKLAWADSYSRRDTPAPHHQGKSTLSCSELLWAIYELLLNSGWCFNLVLVTWSWSAHLWTMPGPFLDHVRAMLALAIDFG